MTSGPSIIARRSDTGPRRPRPDSATCAAAAATPMVPTLGLCRRGGSADLVCGIRCAAGDSYPTSAQSCPSGATVRLGQIARAILRSAAPIASSWDSGESVTKGEKGIAILAPVTYKTKPTAEPHHGPDEQHDEKPDATGARRLHGFKVEYVFDPLSRDSMSRLVVAGRRVLIEYLRARGLVRFRLFGGPFEPLPLVRRRPARAGQMRATRPAWAADVRATNRTPGPSLARHRS